MMSWLVTYFLGRSVPLVLYLFLLGCCCFLLFYRNHYSVYDYGHFSLELVSSYAYNHEQDVWRSEGGQSFQFCAYSCLIGVVFYYATVVIILCIIVVIFLCGLLLVTHIITSKMYGSKVVGTYHSRPCHPVCQRHLQIRLFISCKHLQIIIKIFVY